MPVVTSSMKRSSYPVSMILKYQEHTNCCYSVMLCPSSLSTVYFSRTLDRSQLPIVISHLKACYFKGVPLKEVLVSFSDLMTSAFVTRSSSMNNH